VKAALIFAGLILTACAKPSMSLVNDQGRSVQCGSWGFGAIGTVVALASYQHCVSSYRNVGYHIPGENRSGQPSPSPASQISIAPQVSTPAPTSSAIPNVISRDGRLHLLLPACWAVQAPTQQFPSAQIHARNPSNDAALLVTTEARSDVVDLKRYGETTRATMSAKLAEARASEVTSLVVTGRPAVRFDMAGEANGVRVHFLVTAIEGARVTKLVAWTTQSRFAASRSVFESIAESVSETATVARAE
jgi:hypothetical protein